ncbi:MAG: hypothetical protein AAF763_16640 [Pseudomonadota bacterium]
MQDAPPPVHFFVHVPKCAGTTVEAHFARHLGPDGFLLAPRWRHPLRDIVGNRYPDVDLLALRRVQVVSGHSLSRAFAAKFTGRALREHVLIRDPLSYLVSFYNYRWARHEERGEPTPPPFADWTRTQRRNPLSRFLLHRYFGVGYPSVYRLSSRARFELLERAFAGFAWVSAWTRADEAIAALSAQLGLPTEPARENVGQARRLSLADIPEDSRRALEAEHALDLLLFERWKDRGADPSANPPDPEGAARALSGTDALAYLPADLESAIRRKLWR